MSEIDKRLQCYGTPSHGNKPDPLDELVFIILSAQTEAYNYEATFEKLRNAFPDWTEVCEASEQKIASVIRAGGLANKKAGQLKGAITKIRSDFGSGSLEALRDLGDREAEEYLTFLPGIGLKSAKCILMYSLGRSVFPVDTHVWRVSRRLGLAAQVPKPSKGQAEDLEKRVPLALRHRLHVNMVAHGRVQCLTYRPRCAECILADLCPSAFKPDDVWGNWRNPQGHWAAALAPYASERS